MRGKFAAGEHFVMPQLKDTIFGSIGWKEEEWTAMADALQETGAARPADMDAAGIEMITEVGQQVAARAPAPIDRDGIREILANASTDGNRDNGTGDEDG